MSEFIEKDGEQVEVFTTEEIEEQKQEAIEQFKADNPDKTGELTELQEKLKEAEEKLQKSSGKDQNFSALRKAKEDAEKKVDEVVKGIDDKISKVKMEVMEGVLKDHYNDTLNALSGGDEELKKKIEFNYKRLGDLAVTKQEITNKFIDAAKLAGQVDVDAVNMSVFSSGGVGRIKINNTNQKFSSEEQELGAKFGLKSDDFKSK